MQVILLEKVVNLGNLGDIVKVKEGYGRNFLIPQRKAQRATEANKAQFAARRAEIEKQQTDILAAAQALGEKLTGFVAKVAQKAGVDGRLFGSVNNADIASVIAATGVEVVKSQVRLPNGPLKMIGEHPVTIALHHDVVVDITVKIVAEE